MKKMILLMIVLLGLCGCNTVISENTEEKENVAEAYDLSFNGSNDSSYEINGSTYVSLGSDDIKITKGGTYILEGTLEDASIIVEVSEDEDVQLVLNGVTIHSGDFAGIYIVEGDEITITLAEGSINSISDSGTYTQIDSNNVDALIYSKADLIINGEGTLKLNSSYNHGIVSKDDLIIVSGTYDINVAGQGLSGKDRLLIENGDFNIVSGKDALKSDNEEESKGYVSISNGNFVINTSSDGIYGYNLVNIEDGTFDITTVKSSDSDSFKAIKSENLITISAGILNIDSVDDGLHSNNDISITGGTISIESDDDGIHGDGKVQIDGGDITISAHEGIEATYVLINDGNISISASDDGINAGQKSSAYTATVEINGGYIHISMGQGDTDGIDSNGYLYINGGTIDIYGQSPFDYDKGAEFNGGTILVNGQETNQITNQFMGGGMGGQMPGNNNNGNLPTQPGDSGQSPGSERPGRRPGGH